jgi:2-methylisocitrate lyase-like PEP mutase family enzyme
MTAAPDTIARFRQLHRPGEPLLMPNAFSAGTARLLASLGFAALATTSGGHAHQLGRLDGSVTAEEALAHAAELAAATDLPVSADLEHGFADDPAGVAATVRRATATGLAGCSIEDATGRADEPVYDRGLAVERVAAAAEAAHGSVAEAAHGSAPFVLTARAENHIRGVDDLADTIARLQAYGEAGADVLFAPGLTTAEDIRAVVSSVDQPVSVLVLPGVPPVEQLAELGVARVSVGSELSYVALAAVADAARELLAGGEIGYWPAVGAGMALAREAFPPSPAGRRGPNAGTD